MGAEYGVGRRAPVQLMIGDPSRDAGLLVEAPEFEAQVVKCYYCTACRAVHQENEPEFRSHRKYADVRGVWERSCLIVNPKEA